jgi:hypothetical protein
MTKPRGRSRPLSLARRLVTDFVHSSQRVPTVCMERRMPLGPVHAARALAEPRPGWCAVFTKALAIVSAKTPRLRQAYLSFPWPRFYESSVSVAAVAVERPMGGDVGVGFVLLPSPEAQPLATIHAALVRGKTTPEQIVAEHRRALRIARLPRPLRRWAWWFGLNASGRQRVRHFGTFGVTTPTVTGATALHVLSPFTTMLTYGLVAPNGMVDVRLTFDHRVLDGGGGGRVLADLEAALLSDIAAELASLRAAAAA